MSADNEIAIVKFPNGKYRIAEIHGCPGKDDLEWILTAFSKDFKESEEYATYELAYKQAEIMEQIIEASGYLEYGFSDWESKEPLESYIDGVNQDKYNSETKKYRLDGFWNGRNLAKADLISKGFKEQEADEYLRSLVQAEIVQS